jgi:hypothetical protein
MLTLWNVYAPAATSQGPVTARSVAASPAGKCWPLESSQGTVAARARPEKIITNSKVIQKGENLSMRSIRGVIDMRRLPSSIETVLPVGRAPKTGHRFLRQRQHAITRGGVLQRCAYSKPRPCSPLRIGIAAMSPTGEGRRKSGACLSLFSRPHHRVRRSPLAPYPQRDRSATASVVR